MTVTVRSFAKINLGLRIGAARADGFHELLTVYQTIGLHDLIHVSVESGSGIEIRCADPRVPRDETNTCFRVAERALPALRGKGHIVIEIEKRLPVQGGLGGASANAVATLFGLERALKKRLSAGERLRIASEVGSDLPLFLVGGTVLGIGRGEQVYPLEDLPALACVVVTPEVGVSTPRAFAEWDRRQGLKPSSSGSVDAALKGRSSTVVQTGLLLAGENPAELRSAGQPRAAVPTQTKSTQTKFTQTTSTLANSIFANSTQTGSTGADSTQGYSARTTGKLTVTDSSDRMNELGCGLSAWLSELYSGAPFGRGRAEKPLLELVRAGIKNDFEEVVFPEFPELAEGKKALLSAGAKYASLSGSGSTLYGLFFSKAAAVQATAKLKKKGWAAQVSSTLTRREYWKRVLAEGR